VKAIIWLVCLFALSLTPLTASKIGDDFDNELQRIDNDAAALALIRTYLPKAQDVDDFRKIQNLWLKVDAEACTRYFLDL